MAYCKLSSQEYVHLFAETGLKMAAISLQDLTAKFPPSQDRLDEEVSEEHLRVMSRIIVDHETVGLELGLTVPELAEINHDATTLERQKMYMLRKWKQKFALKATYRQLIEALLRCCRGEDAQNVCKLLAQSKA